MNRNHNYYVYILTNDRKTVLYTGVTTSLLNRIAQHKADAFGSRRTFAGRYSCYHLIYAEHFQYINNAIARETELKGWSRAKKEALINSSNPNWEFLNKDW